MSTINRTGSNQSITGTASADLITGVGSNLTATGGAGNDTINVTGSNAKITGDAGNDVISATGSNVTANGGAGNDTLTSAGGNVSLSGDTGNDVLKANVGEVSVEGVTTTTLNGGSGSNTLSGSKYKEIFQVGTGNDTILNYGTEDTIHVATNMLTNVSVSGSDVVLKIVPKITGSTSYSVTVKNAAGKPLTIKNSSGTVTTQTYGGETASGGTFTQQEIVKKFIASLDKTTLAGSAALDEAIRACSTFTSLREVIDQMISDIKAAGSGDKFLREYCGIILNNEDTGAITGSDAGDSATKTAESVVPESVPVSKWTDPTYGGTSTYGALKVNWPSAGADGKTFTDQEKFILRGLNSTWIKDSLALIQESTGLSFSNASIKTINVILENGGKNGVPARNTTVHNNYTGITDTLNLFINMGYFQDPDYSNENGFDNATKELYMDRNVAHELTHTMLAANVKWYAQLPAFISEGLSELIHGIDYRDGIPVLAANSDKLAQVWNTAFSTSGDDTPVDNYTDVAGVNSPDYAGGFIFWRYLAHQAASYEISGSAANSTLQTFRCNDTLTNGYSNVKITSGAGDDSIKIIYANTNKNTIDTGDGNDSLWGVGSNGSIDMGAGHDLAYIYSNDSAPTLNAGAGNDTVQGVCEGAVIFGGSGNDSVIAYYNNSKAKIDGGEGNDLLYSSGKEITLLGGSGADLLHIYMEATKNLVDGGEGNDHANIWGSDTSVSGGEGNDTINVLGAASGVTVNGGEGNDAIYANSVGNIFQYTYGDGNDTIFGYKYSDTLFMPNAAAYDYATVGSDIHINLGGGRLTLKDAAGKNFHTEYGYNEGVIVSWTNNKTVNGTSGDDVFSNNTIKTTIKAGNGNDFINSNGSNNKFEMGAGNDTVYIYDSGTLVEGGAGADFVTMFSSAANNTINGGAGNDTIYSSGKSNVFVYESDGGSDVIYNFSASDTLSLASSSFSTTASGSDILVKTGSNSITLKNAKGKTLNIVTNTDISLTSGGDSLENTVAGAKIFAGTGDDLVKNLSANVIVYGEAGKDTLENYLGESSSIFGGAGDDSIKNWDKNSTADGEAGNDIILNYGGIQSKIFGGAGNDYIFNSYWFTSAETVYSNNALIDAGAGNDTVENTSANVTIQGGAGSDSIILSGTSSKNLLVYNNGDGSDVVYGFKAGDTIQISGSTSSISTSGSDIVIKIGSGKITLKEAAGSSVATKTSGSFTMLTLDTLEPVPTGWKYGTAAKTNTNAKIMTATLASAAALDASQIYGEGVVTINASITSGGASLKGNSLNNSIRGGKGADTIFGGLGNDTVSLGAGADVYFYEGGSDWIQDYKAGEDKIKLVGASITGSSLSGSNVVLKTTSGNITFKSGKDKQITVIDAAGKETSQVYPSLLNYDADKTSVTLASGFSGTLKATEYDSTVKKIDASAVTKAININGNAQANIILGSAKVDTIYGANGNDSISGAAGADKLFGDAGNDTLWGGAGNDTLTGGAGSDTFVFGTGEGKDVIADYTAGQDSIKISSGSISKTAYSGNNVVFTVGSGTLTVKNAKGKAISIVDASGKISTKTYTTGVSYGSNGNVAVPWFAEEDNNFISGETNLDAITEKNYSVTNFSATSFDNFAQLETPSLAAGGDK